MALVAQRSFTDTEFSRAQRSATWSGPASVALGWGKWLLLLAAFTALPLHAATPELELERPPAQATTAQKSPYPHPGQEQVQTIQWGADARAAPPRILTTLDRVAGQPLPTLNWLAREDVQRQNLHFIPQQRTYPGLYRSQPLAPAQPVTTGGLADPWSLLLGEEFAQPSTGCVSFGTQSGRVQSGWQTIGAGPHLLLQPQRVPGQTSWFVCGPFTASRAGRRMVQFTYRLGVNAASADRFFFGISNNGRNFQGVDITGFTSDWLTQQVFMESRNAESFWVAWAFTNNTASSEGLWLDDLQVWHYHPPAQVCGGQQAGNKGVVLPAYDPTANPPAAMIRAGDVTAAANLQAAGVRWVRLGFQIDGSNLDLLAYDRMIDTLCAHGISVLGLLNHEMLLRTDYANPDDAAFTSYQQEFVALTQFLARYFAHRIQVWEIWNEPNLGEGAYLSPVRYATLLQHCYGAIKRVNPQAQVIFGGLASAWPDSHAYLAAVYAAWQSGGLHPFDLLALHPYPRKREGPDPAIFFRAEPEQKTILDKFLQLMAEQGDGHKRIWITELGFNSAKTSSNRPRCLAGVLVDESQQATYAVASLDILFQQITLWAEPTTPAVEKVFWYQYMDVGALDPCWPRSIRGGHPPKDWWFGLYRGDKVTPKPVWCAFTAYPLPCGADPAIYLPVIKQGAPP